MPERQDADYVAKPQHYIVSSEGKGTKLWNLYYVTVRCVCGWRSASIPVSDLSNVWQRHNDG